MLAFFLIYDGTATLFLAVTQQLLDRFISNALIDSIFIHSTKRNPMEDWMIWFGMAGILVISEIFTGTFYLLMIALGSLAGGRQH